MSKTLVSVIVTTFNSEKHIERTLNSIINQEGINIVFDIELIIADDCSTDATLTLVKKYNPILIKALKNSGGPNKGRNKGLQKASGNYICIVDHDDQWKKNRILKALPYLKKAPIVSSGYTLIDQNKHQTIQRVSKNTKDVLFFNKNATFLSKLTKSLTGQNVYLGSLIYASNLKNILFEEKYGAVDFDWILHLFYQQESIEICEPLYNRYLSGSNLSLNPDYRKKDFDYSLESIEKYRSEFPKETAIAYKKIHGSRARYFYLIGEMKLARKFFLKSNLNFKTLAYYLTTFYGAKFVRKKFNIFG